MAQTESSGSTLRVDVKQGYAIVSLCREPVNTMDLSMWEQLTRVLDQLEADPTVRGVIFQSGLQRDVFTAGNDLMELYAPKTSLERYRQFWLTSNRFLARLYASPLVTVASIRGACPAGGCCLALCCDHRVMTEAGSIGLNEVALGISVPKYWGMLMQRAVGVGPADKLLQFAQLVDPQRALAMGLVDELAPRHELQSAAEAAMARMLQVPDPGRAETKRLLRGEFSEAWARYAAPEADAAWRLLCSPQTVAQLGAVLERLSGKRAGGNKL